MDRGLTVDALRTITAGQVLIGVIAVVHLDSWGVATLSWLLAAGSQLLARDVARHPRKESPCDD
jgi:hypothetical protein